MSDSGITSTTYGASCYTPTHTTISSPDTYPDSPPTLSLSLPVAHETFIIRHPHLNLVITLKDDNLRLHPLDITNTNCHWRVIETASGWLGFRNIQSDTFIRHNNSWDWKFLADVKHHSLWEYFSTRPAPDGRHELLVKHWFGFRAMRVGGEGGRELLVAQEGEKGVAWEFIKVG
ncbi:hypothetical protein BJX99DRAFT_226314 [Aspergillus californicus]